MIVQHVEILDKRKVIVMMDTGERFPLYKGEIKSLSIEEGMEIKESTIWEINEILKKRCKERVLYILERTDKTEQEIRKKLKSSYYSDEMIDITVDFLKKYDYINDYRYASNYINQKKDSKSRRQMEYEMTMRGISRDIISNIFESQEFDSRKTIEKILKNRKYDFQSTSKEQRDKQVQYLLRKGFLYEDIIAVIKES